MSSGHKHIPVSAGQCAGLLWRWGKRLDMFSFVLPLWCIICYKIRILDSPENSAPRFIFQQYTLKKTFFFFWVYLYITDEEEQQVCFPCSCSRQIPPVSAKIGQSLSFVCYRKTDHNNSSPRRIFYKKVCFSELCNALCQVIMPWTHVPSWGNAVPLLRAQGLVSHLRKQCWALPMASNRRFLI